MSLNQIFLNRTNELAGVEFDVLMSEDHEMSVGITDNPVAMTGTISVTDHIYTKPRRLTLNCFQSDIQPFRGLINFGLTGFISQTLRRLGSGNAATRADEWSGTRSASFVQVLETTMDSGIVLDVQTNLRLYRSMLIESIRVVQDVSASASTDVQVTLREIQKAEIKTVTFDSDLVGPTEEDHEDRLSGKSSDGAKAPKEGGGSILSKWLGRTQDGR